jgi:hypothetical protein
MQEIEEHPTSEMALTEEPSRANGLDSTQANHMMRYSLDLQQTSSESGQNVVNGNFSAETNE